jgi:hypothetical protein
MPEEGHQDTLSRVAAIYAEVLAPNQATTLYEQKVLEIRTPDRPYWQKCKATRPIIDAIEELRSALGDSTVHYEEVANCLYRN